ncbi:TonB-dependent receptor [Ferrimonas balearica DSM 9799]|uniref:TonB-dependent receptor n=1 Tax=Ferrimonas balearica (strain DSM 9799 / CCM 4581 / KCTC 23876 / PAT) TaxID=550540 RepID=E1SVJ4_FERBD|nr:TonB-dependent receptor [Ferrimonas balearica]ADN75340.1 TonB-dependent receptor [Ferrimonas balearica DSM 9799]
MLNRTPVSQAVILALLSSPAFAQTDEETTEAKLKEVETITITATKRRQNIQATPVAVQAMSESDLRDQNIGNFDDFVRYMPNVSLGGRGPGQSDVFIRGMAIQPISVMLSGAQGTMPNVALYLDEQPVTAPGRNLDVYAADLERIEVLPGPQGTLFGASSQAGTIRYITNKPRLDAFTAGFSGSVEHTENGEMSNAMEGFLNLPLTENLAVRATLYNVHRGGYIDNVYGEFTLDPSINPDSAVAWLPEDTTYETAYNTPLVEDDFNDSFYKGYRLGLKYRFNDDWELLVQHMAQEVGADGVFDYDPEVGDLQVQRYFPDKLRDAFGQTSWTLEGRLGTLEMIYTGAFLDREVEQSIDYTGYNNAGAFIAYYTCTYDNPDYIINYGISPDVITDVRECKDPTKGFKGFQEHTRMTHEFRVTTDINQPWRVTAGVFYDDYEIETQDDFLYLATPELGFAPNAPISGANNINNSTRPPGVAFFNDITRTEEQIALFGELSVDFTERLTATVGLRWYDIESDFTGSSNFANGIFQGSVDSDRGRDYDSSGGHSTEPLSESDWIPKVNLSYQATDDVLLYTTYSEGFRPGGFNRGGGIPSNNPEFPDVGVTYGTDEVINYEAGWKSMLFGRTLRWNGNLYFIEWNDMQVSRFDPVNVSILTFIENAADSEILGLETDVVWNATDNLTLYAAVSYNDTELTAITGEAIELAPIGSELPLTPEFQGNVRARYDWELGEYLANWQVGVQYAGKSWSSIVAEERERQDSYTLVNASVGIDKDEWGLKFYIDNLTDERAELFINNQDDTRRISTNRPRTFGMALSYYY